MAGDRRAVGRNARRRAVAVLASLGAGFGCQALLGLDGYSFELGSGPLAPDGGSLASLNDAGCDAAGCGRCSPDAGRCNDGVPERCDREGQAWIALEPCAGDAPACVAGACVTCVPDSTGCADAARRMCAGDGRSWIDLGTCSGERPACFGGACVACSPDATRCRDNAPERCASDGQSWQSAGPACGGDSPACLAALGSCGRCMDGERQCEGDAPLHCEGGGWVEEAACTGDVPVCEVPAGACGCAPAAERCPPASPLCDFSADRCVPTYVQLAYIKASNTKPMALGGSSEQFGSGLGLSSDAAILAIGAAGEASAAAGVDPLNGQADSSAPGSGAVYVFERSEGGLVQRAYVKAFNSDADDHFGQVIALDADGDTLLVSAPGEDGAAVSAGVDDDQGSNNGAAYLFIRSGTAWAQQAYIKAANGVANDYFGFTLALSGDGDVMAIGALDDRGVAGVNPSYMRGDASAPDSGAVYVFRRSGSAVALEAYIKASNPGGQVTGIPNGDRFGAAVALSADGQTLAVGAPQEYGGTTGINGDQSDESAPERGAVYVFTRDNGAWTQQAYVKPSSDDTANTGYWFGSALGLSSDGNVLAVGAPNEAVSTLDENGDSQVLVGAGGAYVFERSAGLWRQSAHLRAANVSSSASFGEALSLAPDGNTLAIDAPRESSSARGVDGDAYAGGAFASGAVYVFSRHGSSFAQTTYLKSSNSEAGDFFGVSLAVSGDGKSLCAGATNESSSGRGVGADAQSDNASTAAGAAYCFAR